MPGSLTCDPTNGEVQYQTLIAPLRDGPPELSADVVLAFRRCKDFDPQNQSGQDYAAARSDDEYCVGVVADGVSQSFYGHFAARCVGQALLEFLWQHRRAAPDASTTDARLLQLEAELARQLEQFEVPRDLPFLHRAALEETRKDGSQTVFSAFLVDIQQRTAVLYQVGDVIVEVGQSGELRQRPIAPPKGRWSSAGKSRHLMLRSMFEQVDYVTALSDGVPKARRDEPLRPRSQKLSEQIADEGADYDDVSWVTVYLRPAGQPSAVEPAVLRDRHDPRPPLPPPPLPPMPPPRRMPPPVVRPWWRRPEFAAAAAVVLLAIGLGWISQQTFTAAQQRICAAVVRGDARRVAREFDTWFALPDVNAVSCNGELPLVLASLRQDAATVTVLAAAGADVNALGRRDTALTAAIRRGDARLARRLVDLGASRTVRTRDGESPSGLARRLGFRRLGDFLNAGSSTP